jgi:DNA repair protein RadD
MLRDYQQRAIDHLYEWFQANDQGHPCLVLPTGAGKSHVVAALCKDALQNWPETRVLMLTHVRELIEQNAEKMRQHWPGAPLGIYSAGLRKRDLGEPITFAGIQSVRNKADKLGHVDLVIVDECHLINHRDEGGYRKLIGDLEAINPALRVIGLTATPYRLGHGYITDGDALFDDLIEPVTVEELVHRGYLAPVRSKVTDLKFETDGVHKRGGEYIEKELQAAVNTPLQNDQVVREVIKLAGNRRAWLFFCTGVKHAESIADLLTEYGITAACVTGDTPGAERDRILAEYKAGRIRALTNANVLTTGFDYPDIDLIAMLRPTLSPTLYVQMVGRGMRLKSRADHCLVLDFAGCVQTHGPITAVRPPKQGTQGTGEAPVKLCPNCDEIVHLSARACEACGYEFPAPEKRYELHDVDIMGGGLDELEVTSWKWTTQASRKTGIEMLVVTYYGALSDPPVKEYVTVMHDGYAGQRARHTLFELTNDDLAAKREIQTCSCLSDIAHLMEQLPPPDLIKYAKNGKFFDIKQRVFND